RRSCPTELTEDPLHQVVQPDVENEKIQAEKQRRQNDDHRRRIDLLLRRPRHTFQLVTNLAEKKPRTSEAANARFLDGVKLVGHGPWPLLLAKLAGQEGIEPPTPGFGDRCS